MQPQHRSSIDTIQRPPLAWPGWPLLRHFLLLYLILGLEFALVYFGADMLTAHRTTRLHLYLQGELAIPLFPPLVLAYLSIYLIWLPAPFILRGRAELDSLAVALATVILVAGCGFLALPATLGFAGIDVELSRLDPASLERWGRLLQFASLMSLKFNLVPSLHVAFFVATAGVYMHYTGWTARAVLGIWAVTIAASTLLTHQHHVIDVVTGAILGIGGACLANRVVVRRLQHRKPSRDSRPDGSSRVVIAVPVPAAQDAYRTVKIRR